VEKLHNSTLDETAKKRNRLDVAYIRIDELTLDRRNPRSHTRRHIRQVKRSIESFGFNVPIVIDAKLKVICGHARVLAAKALGWIEVPTIKLEHLSESQAMAFMIADNRLNELSIWNDEFLAEQLKELSLQDLDFSLEATGFDMGEIDLRIQTSLTSSEANVDPGDEIPDSLKGPPVTRLGDLWLLLKHRILCASALERSSYSILMRGHLASAVFSDPPYNVPILGNVSGLGVHKHREFLMASGEMNSSEFETYLTAALTLLARNSIDGSIHFLCMDWRHLKEILAAGRTAYTELKNICVWVKHNAGMGSFYRSQHELVLVFKNGHAAHRNNIQLGQYGRSRTNVWNYQGINSFGRAGEEGNLLALHPTVKPIALVADAILDCTARGDVVLDGFLGSGTTALAATRTGRICYGLEIDPIYVDTTVRRLQKFSGATAFHATSGRSFNELEEEAGNQNVD
jgi:DNA modification methylase